MIGKRFRAGAVLAAGSMFAGCAYGPTPLRGWAYTDVRYPSDYPGATEKGPGTKMGTSNAVEVLGLVALGDASIQEAARKGGIKNIHTVDHKFMNILGLFASYDTIVTGE